MDNSIEADLEAEIVGKIQALYLDQLSYREIVDRLVEQGYSRPILVAVIHKMTSQRRLSVRTTGPFAFLVGGILLLLWGTSPSAFEASNAERTIKLFAMAAGGFVLVPVVMTIIIPWYYRIPCVRTFLAPILLKRLLVELNVKQLDRQFLKNELTDAEYENRLMTMLGQDRGRRHFRWMRNHKHFGLDLELDT